MDRSADPIPLPPRRCPLCGRPAVWRFRPFCSAGCRDRDLLAWLGGRRGVPGVDLANAAPGEAEEREAPSTDHGP